MYLNTDFCHVKNFFWNILLKTTWLYDVRLQNYGVINLVPFLDHPVWYKLVTSDTSCRKVQLLTHWEWGSMYQQLKTVMSATENGCKYVEKNSTSVRKQLTDTSRSTNWSRRIFVLLYDAQSVCCGQYHFFVIFAAFYVQVLKYCR